MPLIPAIDIIDLKQAISANADVAASTALRHNRVHTLLSTADHSDVTGTASNGNVLAFKTSNNKWQPVALVVTADGGTR